MFVSVFAIVILLFFCFVIEKGLGKPLKKLKHICAEQDQEYEESLRIDREKETQARKKEMKQR